MGLILNRPSDIPLSVALEGMVQAKGRNDTIYVGGPVGRSGALALLRARAAPSGAARVLDGLFLISNRAGLAEALKTGVTSGSLRVYVGYAGWSPGRLEAEVAQRMWHVVAGTMGAVFDPYPGSLWRRLIPGAEPKLARLQ
jgi:putative transcriptional regulator